MKTIKFNTNRTYTAHGQRIAAASIDNGVYMVDIDRGLNYFLPSCPLSEFAVMNRYDKGDTDHCPPSLNNNLPGLTYPESCARLDAFLELRADLEKLAAE